jgi:ATP-binding cassette subfamily B multidrug efflux pump
MIEQDEAIDRGYDAALLRRLLVYIKPYRGLTSVAVLLLLVGAGLALVGPALTQRALDVAIPQRDLGLLGTLAALFLAALVLDFVVEYGQTLLTAYIGQRVMYDLRMQIFGHLQRLSISYFDRNPVGRLMSRVTSVVETLNELFSSGVVTVFGDVFTLLAIMTMMLVVDWRLALVTFSVIPLVWLTGRSGSPACGSFSCSAESRIPPPASRN